MPHRRGHAAGDVQLQSAAQRRVRVQEHHGHVTGERRAQLGVVREQTSSPSYWRLRAAAATVSRSQPLETTTDRPRSAAAACAPASTRAKKGPRMFGTVSSSNPVRPSRS
ncbi:hypothetical protein ACFQZC_16620 [Streptacidiphilus monticola]